MFLYFPILYLGPFDNSKPKARSPSMRSSQDGLCQKSEGVLAQQRSRIVFVKTNEEVVL